MTTLSLRLCSIWFDHEEEGLFRMRKCCSERVKLRSAHSSSRSQCGAGGAVISQSSLEKVVTTVVYIWLQFSYEAILLTKELL